MSWFRRRKKRPELSASVLKRALKMARLRIRNLENEVAAAEAALAAVKEQCDKRMAFAEHTLDGIMAVFSQAAQTPGVAVDREAMNFQKWADEFAGEEEDEGEDTEVKRTRLGIQKRIDELWGNGLDAHELAARRKAYDDNLAQRVVDKEQTE
jgi:hypothetical protein